MQLATSVSMTDTQLVSAAKPRARKNTMPTMRPTPPMEANTRGRLMKVRLGLLAMPSTPRNTYTEGMIMMPARKATPVSKISIWPLALFRSTSSFT